MSRASFIFCSLFLCSCSTDPEPTRRTIGEPCIAHAECEEDLQCLDELPEGLCSRTCESDCPEGSTCVDLAGEGYCFPLCEDSEDCREGYACSLGAGAVDFFHVSAMS